MEIHLVRGHGAGRAFTACFFLMLCVLAPVLTPSADSASAPASSPPPYDLTVLVLALPVPGVPSPTATQVALSYSHTVEHERLRAAIGDLMARAGGNAAEIVIRDTPLNPSPRAGEGTPELATDAQFLAHGLVSWSSGMLPVGAVIRSIPDWQHLRLVFVVGEQFAFLGPTGAIADGFALRLINQVAPYEYDVERMSERLNPPKELDLRGRRPPLLPAGLIGLVTGLAAGWMLAAPLSRGSG